MTRPLIYLILLATTLLCLSSYRYHTAVGIDHDYVQKDSILHTYYRINWSGNGSVWMGYGTFEQPADKNKPLEFIDPAAVFFKPVPKKMLAENLQHTTGFSLINARQPRDVFWLIIPAWLPILLSALLWLFIRRRHHLSNASATSPTPHQGNKYSPTSH
uniref:Uncharacterized protein n=1 Tax=uncultured Thiotrichaceae bacterium TaxID=298394 RepID=A0A6S6UKL0_9GAMM|nr:MAG: Unknown protein [uncultured Thiotrichaceae bacterium]